MVGAFLAAMVLGAFPAPIKGPTLAAKVRRACFEIGISDGSLTVPAALMACNEAMGIEASGTLIAQADELVSQLGLSFDDAQPPTRPAKRQDPLVPRLVVFDLDFTLWKPELYQLHSGPPFRACSDGCVLTARGERLDLFPAARTALVNLADAGVPVAIASRASEVAWAK